jgi:hypothetical protein
MLGEELKEDYASQMELEEYCEGGDSYEHD